MKQKNEAGYTLVLVLLTITLIFIFSATLISNVLNSAAQNKKAEEQIQLKQSSRMGVTYVESAIIEASKVARISTEKWLTKQINPIPTDTEIATEYKKNFKSALNNIIDYQNKPETEVISKETNKYRFKISNITIIEESATITVKYIITPSFNNEYGEQNPVREKKINLAITQPASS